MTQIDCGRGLIEWTGFDGPVLFTGRVKGKRRYAVPKNPGSRKGRRVSRSGRDWYNPKGKLSDAYRFWKCRTESQISRFRCKPGFPNYSRSGVPDGYTRAEVVHLWQEARVKAVNRLMELIQQGKA